MKKRRIVLTCAFSLINIFIFVEALIPSSASSVQSESIADAIGGIIQTVNRDDFSYVAIEGISIEGPDEITVGTVNRYDATISPKNASFPSLIWESLNPDIAIVNQFGRVTGIKEGTTTIRAKSEEKPDIYDTFEVSVISRKIISPSSIKIINPPEILKRNISFVTEIEMDVDPLDCRGDIVYESSDTSIAEYADGIIKTYKAGQVVLSVKSVGNKETSFSFNLEVLETEGIKPSSISLEVSESYYVNRETDVEVNFNEEVEDENVIYFIEDESVATYKEGLRGLKEGTTSMRVCRLFDEAICSSSYQINVKNVEASKVEIVINGQETDLIVGKTLQLRPLFTPSDVTIRNVTWSIDDVGSAKISENGLVIGLNTKTIKVSMHHEDSNITAEKEFSIKESSTLTKKELQELSGRIRKIVGHFGLFMINGFVAAFAFIDFEKKSKKEYLIATSIGLMTSVTAELLQLIPTGRSCQISDMAINFAGFVLGILCAYVCYAIYEAIKRKKHRQIEKKQKDVNVE